jgi:hypothetical protein
VRVLTSSFRKMRFACDFTVFGEIWSDRATRLLEQPWLIIKSMWRSRAVRVALTQLLSCGERPFAYLASHHESRLPTKGRSLRSVDPGASARM